MSRKFQGCFKEDLRVFTENFKGFQGSLKGVSRKLQECFKKVSMVFKRSATGVSGKFQRCFKEVQGGGERSAPKLKNSTIQNVDFSPRGGESVF